MGDAIGQMLPFAVGVAISPMPIVAVVLMLVTPWPRSNGPAFVLGWVLGLAVVGGIVLAVAGPTAMPATTACRRRGSSWLKLVLGLGLVLIAVKQWWGRPHDPADVKKTPKWMSAIDGFTPAKALGIAFLLSAINPKNLLLLVGGAAAIAQTGIPGGEQASSPWPCSSSSPPSASGPRWSSSSSWVTGPPASSTGSRTGWPPTTSPSCRPVRHHRCQADRRRHQRLLRLTAVARYASTIGSSSAGAAPWRITPSAPRSNWPLHDLARTARACPVAAGASHSVGDQRGDVLELLGRRLLVDRAAEAGDERVGTEAREHCRIPAVRRDHQVAVGLQVRREPPDGLLQAARPRGGGRRSSPRHDHTFTRRRVAPGALGRLLHRAHAALRASRR